MRLTSRYFPRERRFETLISTEKVSQDFRWLPSVQLCRRRYRPTFIWTISTPNRYDEWLHSIYLWLTPITTTPIMCNSPHFGFHRSFPKVLFSHHQISLSLESCTTPNVGKCLSDLCHRNPISIVIENPNYVRMSSVMFPREWMMHVKKSSPQCESFIVRVNLGNSEIRKKQLFSAVNPPSNERGVKIDRNGSFGL